VEVCAEISGGDPEKFERYWFTLGIGRALVIWERIKIKEGEAEKKRMQIELMKLDFLAMMLTGKNPGLVEKMMSHPPSPLYKGEEKRRDKKKAEDELLRKLKASGIPVKEV